MVWVANNWLDLPDARVAGLPIDAVIRRGRKANALVFPSASLFVYVRRLEVIVARALRSRKLMYGSSNAYKSLKEQILDCTELQGIFAATFKRTAQMAMDPFAPVVPFRRDPNPSPHQLDAARPQDECDLESSLLQKRIVTRFMNVRGNDFSIQLRAWVRRCLEHDDNCATRQKVASASQQARRPLGTIDGNASADAPDEMRITESSKIVYSEAMEAILEDIDEDAMSDDSDDDEVLDDEVLSGDD